MDNRSKQGRLPRQEKPIPDVCPALDTDLAWDNLETTSRRQIWRICDTGAGADLLQGELRGICGPPHHGKNKRYLAETPGIAYFLSADPF